jgi:ABC-type multidrug transport system ATPase subunit
LEKKMMYDLNRLADQGRTVVLVTHATANIEQCNHVSFLVQGNLAYYGPPREAISFFQARDFADIYLKLSQRVNPAEGKPPPPELQPYYQAWTLAILTHFHKRDSPPAQRHAGGAARAERTRQEAKTCPRLSPAPSCYPGPPPI